MSRQHKKLPIVFHCIDCQSEISSSALRCKLCSARNRSIPITPEQKREQHRRYMRVYYRNSEEQREKAKARAAKYRANSLEYSLRIERAAEASKSRLVAAPEIPFESLAYAAGIIDGEGSIQIRKTKGSNGEVSFTYELSVKVSNTNPKMVDFLARVFGGNAFLESMRGGKHRPVFRWNLSGERGEWFLRLIQPYMVCKKDQVDLAISFRGSFVVRNRSPVRLSHDTIAFREKCYLEMKALHRVAWTEFDFPTAGTRRSGQNMPLFSTIAGQ